MTDRDPSDLSPVYARSERLRPQVSQPNSPWTLVMGLGGVGLLGLVAFTTLSNGREARAPSSCRCAPRTSSGPRPGLHDPGAGRAAAAPAPPAPLPATPQPTPQDLPESHWRAPAVVVDLSEAGRPGAPSSAQTAARRRRRPAAPAKTPG